MDNRIFRVNGTTKEQLTLALQLAFSQCGYGKTVQANGFQLTEHGLLLSSYDINSITKFPTRLESHECVDLVWKWLQSEDTISKFTKYPPFCENLDHDGDNELGWIVYVEDWGKVGNVDGPICAIHPAYMWYGK